MALLFIPILFALPTLFMWARPDVVATDAILQHKAPYLNVTFFMVRAVALLRRLDRAARCLLNKWSAAQDTGEDVARRRRAW